MKFKQLKKLMFIGILLSMSFAYAQTTVTGKVSDADGPLPGASVILKGTNNGTETDFDGKYTLNNVPSDGTIVVSFVGYKSQEIKVNGRTSINITLVEDANQLNEVVVTGYTTQTRGDITGSVASVDMEEATKVPVANAAEALQGRVTGVTVTNNGRPGDAPKINIRGFGTTNNTNPLFIIDGVQTDDGTVLSSLNPQDIDQMNVLKDGAAAIYGARASNGVVIITTKSGGYNMDKPKLSVDMYTGISSASNLPSLLNPQQHGDMIWQSLTNTGATLEHAQYGNGSTPVIPSVVQGTTRGGDPLPTMNVAPGGTKWLDEILQNAQTQNASISLQNGTKSGKYFISASYLNREGVQLNTGFKRGATRLNSEFKIADKVRIGERINISFSRAASPGGNRINEALRMNPLIPVYDVDGKFAGPYKNPNQLGNTQNPVAALERSKHDYRKRFRLLGDIYLAADLLEGLTAKTSLSGNILAQDSRFFTSLNPEAAEPISSNRLAESNINNYSWTWSNTLNYKKSFNDHTFNTLVGIEAVKDRGKGNGISRTDYLFETPDFYLLSTGSGTPNVDFAYDGSSTLFSIFGSVNYSYSNKYYATVTLRKDKSSRFLGDNQSDIFPSFSVGWSLSNEEFFPKDGFLSRVKLKASYGELGNQTLPVNNPTIDISSLSEVYSNYAINGSSIATGASLSAVGNPDLRWETSKSTNIGAEFGMLDNALSLSVEWFNIKTDDLIVQDNSLIPTTGPDANPPYVNSGSVKNTGFDFSVGYNKSTDYGLNYNISANLSTYKNEVTDWINAFQPGAGFRDGAITRTEEGQPISYFYGRIVDGIFASETEVADSPSQNFTSNADGVGRFKYKDINNDGVINDDDRTFIGSPHPDFTYGINLGVDYKGFDISAFFQGSQGNDIYNHEKIYTDFPVFLNGNRSTRVLDSWTPDNTGASLPALRTNVINNETNPNSFFVEDGSYFRLKNLQVGYTISKDVSNKIGMESLRFYLQGTNLFTLTGYEGLDPEIAQYGNLTLGVDSNTFPVSKIMSLGVNIKF